VHGYDAEQLTSALGGRFELTERKGEIYLTRTGVEQPFDGGATTKLIRVARIGAR
jgi:hypothetical protein